MKVSEIAKLAGVTLSMISNQFKSYDPQLVTRRPNNNRIAGVSPEAVQDYFKKAGVGRYYKPAIFLSANLCGGVGKTTSVLNLGCALRRLTSRNTPIVYVDGDSQGSFTSSVFGRPAEDHEPILLNYLEGKASIDDILTEVNDNIWFIKSNLNSVWIDKVLSKPQDIKRGMLRFYEDLFSKFGNDLKVFQDHTPQLSNLFASSICGLDQLDKGILKNVLIPLRSDKFAILGAEHILREIEDLMETFSLPNDINIHCFFSSVDKRVSSTAEAFRLVGSKPKLLKHLSPIIIRYCSEIPKTIMSSSNVFSTGKSNNAAEDYQDLLHHLFDDSQPRE